LTLQTIDDMAYQIEFSEDALDHYRQLTARERSLLADAIDEQLVDEPTIPTRRRKHLRPNQLAEWELRVGDFRVFYDVEEESVVVVVVAIGVKERDKLYIGGEDFTL
jgi:mRNA-degrading endonuclease RelE of RelBE toxin-antitoxin system